MLLINTKINKDKYFFLLKFKFIFFNFKYLMFYKFDILNFNSSLKLIIKKNNLNYIIVKSNDLLSLFKDNFFLSFLKNNNFLIFFNNFDSYLNFKKDLEILSSNIQLLVLLCSGYFINHKYFNKIDIYYLFYNNNFNIIIYIILNFIKLYNFIIYKYILKLLIIISNFFKLKKIIN